MPSTRAAYILRKSSGYTLIELIIVMAMMALLGTTLVAVVGSGGNQYQRIHENYSTENEARIALSYMTVKIRQNDTYITDPVYTGRSVTVLAGPPPVLQIRDSATSRWDIQLVGNQLVESRYTAGSPTPDATATISDKISALSIASDATGSLITIDITYVVDGNAKHLIEKVYLRSDG
mgnify:CR=1 FL=1